MNLESKDMARDQRKFNDRKLCYIVELLHFLLKNFLGKSLFLGKSYPYMFYLAKVITCITFLALKSLSILNVLLLLNINLKLVIQIFNLWTF